MKKLLPLILCAAVSVSAQSLPPRTPPEIVDDANSFSFHLVTQVASKQDKADNIVLAPVGVRIGFAQLREFASIKAAQELDAVTGSRFSAIQERTGFHNLLEDLKIRRYRDEDGRIKTYSSNVAVVNSIWASARAALVPEFLKLNKEVFGTEIYFVRVPKKMQEKAREEMKQTSGIDVDRITSGLSALKPDDFALTSTVSFGCGFAHPYGNESPGLFQSSPPKTVRYVSQLMNFEYWKSEKFTAIEAGCGLYIFLPNEGIGVPEIIKDMRDWRSIEEMRQNFHPEIVVARVPKFRVEADYDLTVPLRDLGIQNIFEEFSSLKAITSWPEGARLSRVLQKNYVDFNGRELKAGSATYIGGVVGGVMAGQAHPIYFFVNRPFVFMIVEEQTQAVLFVGAVIDPGPTQN